MNRLIDYLRSLWVLIFHHRPAPEPPPASPAPVPAPEESPVEEAKPAKRRARREPDTLKKAVLDELATYYPYLARMRKVDPKSYALYRQVGCRLWCGEERLVDIGGLEPWWKTNRPSFGAIAVSGEGISHHRDDYMYPKFWYFRKYEKPPAFVQPMGGGDVYEMTAYFDNNKVLKHGVPITIPILVDGECNVSALKILATRYITVSRRKSDPPIPRHGWGLPSILETWAADHGISPEEYVTSLFHILGNAYVDLAHSIIQVRATKGKVAALFSVDVIKTPQFFADRDVVVGDGGYTKKIFHIVRTHVRANGSAVRSHFKGLRRFTWNGFELEITVPYREHFNLVEFTPGISEFEDREEGIGEGMLGRILEQKRQNEINSPAQR